MNEKVKHCPYYVRTTASTPKLEDLMPEGFEFNRTQFEPKHFCTCNLIDGACDVNCCCDSDCSSDDVKAFSQCKPIQAHNYDRKFCYTSKLYVENNTQFILEEVSF